jgi:hypothetical protein
VGNRYIIIKYVVYTTQCENNFLYTKLSREFSSDIKNIWSISKIMCMMLNLSDPSKSVNCEHYIIQNKYYH